MGKRQTLWARRKRREFMKLLGERCAVCGSTDRLQFDCIEPRGPAHHYLHCSQMPKFWRGQMAENNLQLLCYKCHLNKTLGEQTRPVVILPL